MTITLCYWGVRGVAEPSRYILRYSDTEWTDDRLEPSPDRYGRWMSEKHNIGLDLPNLPYLMDGDIKITQSIAISRYLGRKFGLVPGENERDVVRCDMAEQEVVDLRNAFGRLCYGSDADTWEKNKAAYLENLEKKLAALDKFVGSKGPFILGDKLTYVDFILFEYISQIRKLAPEYVAKAGNVTRLLENVEKLPTLQKYFSSAEYKEGCYINSPRCAFPGK